MVSVINIDGDLESAVAQIGPLPAVLPTRVAI